MNNKMTYSQAEQLKAHIRSRLSGSIAQALNPNPSARRQFNMSGNNPALNPDEFHNKSYVAGSTGEYKDMECSVFFEFEEVLKQIDFKDKKLYVALDVSPGYSPSGKGRNYGNLESMILDLL